MSSLARIFIVVGLFLLVFGLLMAARGRLNLPFGRLPGDVAWRGRNWFVSFPLATSLLLSALLSLLFWVFGRSRR